MARFECPSLKKTIKCYWKVVIKTSSLREWRFGTLLVFRVEQVANHKFTNVSMQSKVYFELEMKGDWYRSKSLNVFRYRRLYWFVFILRGVNNTTRYYISWHVFASRFQIVINSKVWHCLYIFSKDSQNYNRVKNPHNSTIARKRKCLWIFL